MEDRMKSLEEKVDRLTEIFQQMVTNQELMQQELKIMNVTLTKVDNLHLQLTKCSTECNFRMKHFEDYIEDHTEQCTNNKKNIDDRISFRDKIFITLGIKTALILIGVMIYHLTGSGV